VRANSGKPMVRSAVSKPVPLTNLAYFQIGCESLAQPPKLLRQCRSE
jgi:hypothetical protein